MTPDTRRPGRPRDPDVDARVLAAAADLLGSAGYAGLRMDEVATRAGVAKTTVYRRWATRADLVADAVAGLLGELPVLDAADLAGDLLAVARWYAERLADPRVTGGLLGLYAETARDPAAAAALRARLHEPRLAAVRARLEEAGADPGLAEDLLHLLAGAVLHATASSGAALDDRTVHRLADQVARGVLPPGRVGA